MFAVLLEVGLPESYWPVTSGRNGVVASLDEGELVSSDVDGGVGSTDVFSVTTSGHFGSLDLCPPGPFAMISISPGGPAVILISRVAPSRLYSSDPLMTMV